MWSPRCRGSEFWPRIQMTTWTSHGALHPSSPLCLACWGQKQSSCSQADQRVMMLLGPSLACPDGRHLSHPSQQILSAETEARVRSPALLAQRPGL